MSTSRYNLGLAALDGRLYTVGGSDGYSSGYRDLSTVERFWNASAAPPAAGELVEYA